MDFQPLYIQFKPFLFHESFPMLIGIFAVSTPQLAPYFRHDNFRRKWFRDEIIPAIFQSHDLIHFPCPSRYENDRTSGHLPNLTAPIKSIVARQIDIKQYELRFYGIEFFRYIIK